MKLLLKNIHHVLFLIISIIAINFNYVEGDDASMVMFHALGRNSEIQPIYSLYHSMFDSLIGFLPTSENFIRLFSISLSFLSNFIVYLLLLELLKLKKISNIWYSCLLPFILPEMLFGGLYINPTIVSFVVILISHILLLKFMKSQNKMMILLSVLFLGLGTSIRWSNGLYLFVLFGEFFIHYLYKKKFNKLKSKLILSVIVFTSYITSTLLFIYFSGYSLFDIISTYKQGSSYMENKEVSYLSYIANATTYLTPSFITLLLLGCFYVIKNKLWNLLILLFFALFPFFIIGFYPSYKFMITGLPIYIYITALGYQFIVKQYQKKIFFALVLFPWLLGVKVYASSSFGPGFSLKKNILSISGNKLVDNPDNRTKIEKIRVGFYGGLAMPTPEGPRPLGGYLWVLLNDWNAIVNNINSQRLEAVNYAIKHNAIILQDVNHSFISSKLLELGYSTIEPFYNNQGEYSIREYTKGGSFVYIMVPNDKNKLLNEVSLNQIKYKNIVVYSSYTNIINKLGKMPNYISKNTYWGVIELKIEQE